MEYSYFRDNSLHSLGKLPWGITDDYSHIEVDDCGAIAVALLDAMLIIYINFIVYTT
ncbi:hypothetical protein [Nodularia sp. UHCC 0506]|uniref:hypothetical protein n=1 Tax=Nodularia sp. UHCC 0506 TaxID=3110243 RepID=UPI002B2022A8|nr:hypothetical protein [Nodularia sp. UHCC 0506]MEA5516536.1 hypothetical protein [Nodularia sp. UHCC 0506]